MAWCMPEKKESHINQVELKIKISGKGEGMRNITLRNGKSIVVDEKDLDDLSEVVREELSPDIADALEGVITDKILELEEFKRSLAEKMESCEDSLSEVRSALDDISMFVDELARNIRGGMTEEDKIIEELERIGKYAYRVL